AGTETSAAPVHGGLTVEGKAAKVAADFVEGVAGSSSAGVGGLGVGFGVLGRLDIFAPPTLLEFLVEIAALAVAVVDRTRGLVARARDRLAGGRHPVGRFDDGHKW